MTISEKIFQLYQRFYAQRSVLTDAPALTVDVDRIGVADFPESRAFDEMSGVASYLIGRPDIRNIPFKESLRIVQKAYVNQPFWYDLLMDYLELLLNKNEADLEEQGRAIQERAEAVLDKLNEAEARRTALIELYASKIEAEHFPVDAKKLIRNYLKMLKRDAKQAWDVLISNPAYFSPIITKNPGGAQTLSPSQAIEENKRLARFMKGLKG